MDHLWQSTAFALGAGALTVALRNNRADVRYWLWLIASLKFLLPFAMLVELGTHLMVPSAEPIAGASPAVVIQQAVQPFSAADPVLSVRESPIDWTPILATVWAAGCAAVLLLWTVRWRRIAAALKSAEPLAIAAPIPVLSTRSSLEPGLVGLRRPVLLLPAEIVSRLSAEEMAAIVAHEMCHFRRRDNLTAVAHMFVLTIFWFHPLMWWIGTRLMAERERACDEGVLDGGSDPQAYAEGILKVCKFYLHSPLMSASGVAGADLRRRVEMIMEHKGAQRLTLAQVALVIMTMSLMFVVPISAGFTTSSLREALSQLPAERDVTSRLAAQSRPRVAVPFDARRFDAFVGYYQAHAIIQVTREGDRFFTRLTLGGDETRMTPKPVIEIYPESSTKFFAKDVVAQYSFVHDASGQVTELVYHQSGLDRRFTRIDAATARNAEAEVANRVRRNQPAPGTEAALRRYILGIQEGYPNYGELAPGIAVRVRWTLPGAQKRFNAFGKLQSLRFKEVGSDGMDVYTATFSNADVEWWIAPLTDDGRITWSGFQAIAKR